MFGTLAPAFGRDYKSKKEALQDWLNNKDFMFNSHEDKGLINRTQAENLNMTSFQIRWKKLTQAAIIRMTKTGEWK